MGSLTSDGIFKEFGKQLDIIFEYAHLEQYTKTGTNHFIKVNCMILFFSC